MTPALGPAFGPAFGPALGGLLTGQVYEAGITVTPQGDTPLVSTQLRLVEPPEPSSRPASGTKRASKGPAKGTEQSRSRRGRSQRLDRTGTAQVSRTGRRAAAWGDWRLDAGTRQVGRAGVAQARQALEAALEAELDHDLSQAS